MRDRRFMGLNEAAAKGEADRQVSRALQDFYRNATDLVREIQDVGDDPEELERKTQSLHEEIERLKERIRQWTQPEGEPGPGADLDVAAVVNATQGGR
jgi:predicted  nucleic acid-binding Zn-ribbon protein